MPSPDAAAAKGLVCLLAGVCSPGEPGFVLKQQAGRGGELERQRRRREGRAGLFLLASVGKQPRRNPCVGWEAAA